MDSQSRRIGLARLTISLVRAERPFTEGSWVNELRGGPGTLLRWLETKLGLLAPTSSRALRIVRYSALLKRASLKACGPSFEADAWGTAKALLQRRDELRMAGWDGTAGSSLPPVALDIALVEKEARVVLGGLPERLERVLGALGEAHLPAHEVALREPASAWPKAWQPLLGKLATREEPLSPAPAAAPGCALRVAQDACLSKPVAAVACDESFWWHRAVSGVVAAEAVASALAASGEADETLVCCEDARLAAMLDAALRRHGVPGMGYALENTAHPVLHVLPLALALCWDPIDPRQLIDFLTLPERPVPRGAALRLAEAVAEQPGLGGRKWRRAVELLVSPEQDPDGKVKERLSDWLEIDRKPRTGSLDAELVAGRCSQVVRWARGYAVSASKLPAKAALEGPLMLLASQAKAMADLARAHPGPISEPQLWRLLEAVQQESLFIEGRPAEAGGPQWVSSLADAGPCRRMVWLGTHTTDSRGAAWTAGEREDLRKAGVELSDERVSLAQLRAAERAGFFGASCRLWALELASAAESRPHPLWLAASGALSVKEPPVLDDAVAAGAPPAGWPFALQERTPESPPGKRPLWEVDPALLHDRSKISYSEVDARLACPLRWTLEYVAGLRESPFARIAEDMHLKGKFAHGVMEVVFGKGAPESREAAEAAADKAFSEHLPKEAAHFALPSAAAERQKLRSQIEAAAGEFWDALKKGGYEVVGFEHEPGGQMLGKSFTGSVDSLLKDGAGRKAIVDLKYTGLKYEEWVRAGHAVQLAIYSAAAAGDGAGGVAEGTSAAYFVIDSARFYTPEGSPLASSTPGQVVQGGPSVAQTWQRLREAIQGADAWLQSGKIPARPLQDPAEWPPGAIMALRRGGKKADGDLDACKYCPYKALCGVEVIS